MTDTKDPSTLQHLLTRVEAAEDFDRVLDRDLGLAIDGWKAVEVSGNPMLDINGDFYPDHPGSMYPALTESIDEALALVERLLPDEGYEISRVPGNEPPFDCRIWTGSDTTNYIMGEGKTPTLAILAALLRALLARAEVTP